MPVKGLRRRRVSRSPPDLLSLFFFSSPFVLCLLRIAWTQENCCLLLQPSSLTTSRPSSPHHSCDWRLAHKPRPRPPPVQSAAFPSTARSAHQQCFCRMTGKKDWGGRGVCCRHAYCLETKKRRKMKQRHGRTPRILFISLERWRGKQLIAHTQQDLPPLHASRSKAFSRWRQQLAPAADTVHRDCSCNGCLNRRLQRRRSPHRFSWPLR